MNSTDEEEWIPAVMFFIWHEGPTNIIDMFYLW